MDFFLKKIIGSPWKRTLKLRSFYFLEEIMNRKEYLKETIATFRALSLLLITGLFGVCGFLVSHLNDMNQTQFIMSGVGLFFLFSFLIFSAHYLFKRLGELEEI